ncbi:TPA: hypothetical protein DDZ10_03160 [Candidatus Uhrbacteria bacterium]|nr:MAG: hypothetical protein A3D69_03715 [Candidatus Uhrbacteria bacterium RIFCSPHIGHO2_02_FULL_54_11]HBL39646.1 hypothetical protein [Candidatus Uhrbacteria bacterium]
MTKPTKTKVQFNFKVNADVAETLRAMAKARRIPVGGLIESLYKRCQAQDEGPEAFRKYVRAVRLRTVRTSRPLTEELKAVMTELEPHLDKIFFEEFRYLNDENT